VSALYSFFVGWASAADKRSACTQEEISIGVAESVVMPGRPESLEKSTSFERFLELLIVEVRKGGA
jgi:hypothetical protein